MVNWSNWASAVPADRAAWRKWHAEHMAGRLEVPGFLRGRRYGAVDASRSKMTFYELESPGVLASAAYSRKAEEPFGDGGGGTDSVRNIAAVKHSLGRGTGVGGFALTLRLDVLADQEEGFAEHLTSVALPAIAEMGEITGAHFCLGDAEASAIVPVSLQGRMTVGPRWIVMVEGMTPEAVRAAYDTHLSSLERHGCAGPVEPGIYQLEVVLALEDGCR